MKVCIACGISKPLTDFYKRKDSIDGHGNTCKVCRNAYQKQWAIDHPVSRKKHTKTYLTTHPERCGNVIAKQHRQWIDNYKRQRCCMICGEKEIVCLDFHHLNPEDKDYSIGNLVVFSIERIIQEIAKCILVCKNCHAKIHKYGLENEDGKFCITKHTDDTD